MSEHHNNHAHIYSREENIRRLEELVRNENRSRQTAEARVADLRADRDTLVRALHEIATQIDQPVPSLLAIRRVVRFALTSIEPR